MYISRYIINPTFVLAVSIQKQNVQNSFKMADGFEMVFKLLLLFFLSNLIKPGSKNPGMGA